jgi:hypothetical protein
MGPNCSFAVFTVRYVSFLQQSAGGRNCSKLAVILIGLGFLMLFQPFALILYTYSLVTLLAGTVMFIIVSKFPE